MEDLLFWLTSAWARLRGLPAPYRTRVEPDIPEDPEPGFLYLVGDGDCQWFACFLCPCSCGALVQLSTLSRGRPRWSTTRHRNGTVTLHPSIRRTFGCRSHFLVRRGAIEWANENLR